MLDDQVENIIINEKSHQILTKFLPYILRDNMKIQRHLLLLCGAFNLA